MMGEVTKENYNSIRLKYLYLGGVFFRHSNGRYYLKGISSESVEDINAIKL